MRPAIRVLVLVSGLCAATATVRAAEISSRPQRAVVYRDGYAVLEETLGPVGPGAVIRLPAGTDLASVQLALNGKRLGGLVLEEVYEEVPGTEKTVVAGVLVEKSTVAKNLVGYRLHPDLTGRVAKGKLMLRYGTTGIGWQPQLRVEILDDQRVSVTMTAQVSNRVLDLTKCRIRLASHAGPLSSKVYFGRAMIGGFNPHNTGSIRSADQVYRAGVQDIPRDRTVLLSVLSSRSSYQRKLVWHTGSRERVQVALLVANPFGISICPGPVHLYRDGALISRDNAEWAPPDSHLVLAAGQAPDIEVRRSVETTENLANKARPFRHAIEFTVTNRGQAPVLLEAVMPKKIGSRHKTLYHFRRKPDRRPGAVFIWDLRLAKDQTRKVAFHFDSEHPRFAEYQVYEKAAYELF
jgi:hypothetical protein